MKLRVGSLFTGIGGMDLGLERTGGFRTVWMAEAEPYRRRVLARHWPHVRLFRDVRHVHPKTAEAVDLVCGGFPCTDLSDAGPRAGIQGQRSGLWSEFRRVVADFAPSWVLIENVPALARRGLATVLRDLAALGYDAEWACISAADIGAPHPRDRLWIVAYPDGEQDRLRSRPGVDRSRRRPDADAGGALPDADEDRRYDLGGAQAHDEGPARARAGAPGERRGAGGSRSGASPHRHGAAQVVADSEGQPVGSGLRASGAQQERRGRPSDSGGPRVFGDVLWRRIQDGPPWPTEPDVGRMAHGVPSRVDRVAALGDALVPQIVTVLGERILAHYGEHRAGQP